MAVDAMAGPIPGENYTSDTRNYPWHRPPEHTDLDKAIEDITKKLFSEQSTNSILTCLEMGITVAEITQILLMSGVGKGKWTVDFALLLAGPTAHIIKLMAKTYDVEADLGIEDEETPMTDVFFKEIAPRDEAPLSTEQQTDIKEQVMSGFMAGGK